MARPIRRSRNDAGAKPAKKKAAAKRKAARTRGCATASTGTDG